ncbi:hypothetical protein [Aquibacillus sediminis]|uniref:hypothetical protein n=1 Tax=Aquibacillus sediminis TaxID=2574734 RepID=UPI001107D958|nr:hypothetical protein [Aquibacillus sediminis]
MTIDWTVVLTHIISLLIGGTSGYFLKSEVNKKVNKTGDKNSPIFSNTGDVKANDFGDKN